MNNFINKYINIILRTIKRYIDTITDNVYTCPIYK